MSPIILAILFLSASGTLGVDITYTRVSNQSIQISLDNISNQYVIIAWGVSNLSVDKLLILDSTNKLSTYVECTLNAGSAFCNGPTGQQPTEITTTSVVKKLNGVLNPSHTFFTNYVDSATVPPTRSFTSTQSFTIPAYVIPVETPGNISITRPSEESIGVALKDQHLSPSTIIGWRNLSTDTYAKLAVVCSLSSKSCISVICSSGASTVIPGTDDITCIEESGKVTNVTVTGTTISFIRIIADLPIGPPMHLVFATSPETRPSPSMAQDTKWKKYNATLPTVIAFPINFSRPSEATLEVTVSPGEGKTSMLGWRSSAGATFPSDVVICAPSSVSTCLDVACTNATTCIARTPTILSENTASGPIAKYRRGLTALAGTVQLADGTPMHLAWDVADSIATPFNANTASGRAWKYMEAALPAFTPTFDLSISQATLGETRISVLIQSGKFVSLGFNNDAAATFPAVVILCEPVSSKDCGIFTCTSATVCKVATFPVVQSHDSTTHISTIIFQDSDLVANARIDASFQTTALQPNAKLFWNQNQIPSTGVSVSPATVQNQTWNQSVIPVAQTTESPNFPIIFTRSTLSDLSTVISPGVGKTVMLGWRETSSATFPTDVVICAPSSLPSCIDVVCSDAATCSSRLTTILSKNTSSAGSASFTRPLNAVGAKTIVFGVPMYLAYAIRDTTAATITATTAENVTWKFYEADVPKEPVTTPSFPVIFSRKSAAELSVTQVPGTGKTSMLGWRSSAGATFPSDVVICAPSSVSTCLDVACTNATTCIARTPTILSENTASGYIATISRPLTGGIVPLSANTSMILAWDLTDTPASSVNFTPQQATQRSWKAFTVTVPEVGTTTNNAHGVKSTAIIVILISLLLIFQC